MRICEGCGHTGSFKTERTDEPYGYDYSDDGTNLIMYWLAITTFTCPICKTSFIEEEDYQDIEPLKVLGR